MFTDFILTKSKGGIKKMKKVSKTNKLYVTKINREFEGDVYFPEIDEKVWKVVETEKGLKDEKNPYDYEYVTYERKNK